MKDIGFKVFFTSICLSAIAMLLFASLPLFGFDWERSFQLMVASTFVFIGIIGGYMTITGWRERKGLYRSFIDNIMIVSGIGCIPISICGVLSFGFGLTFFNPVIVCLIVLLCVFLILSMIWMEWKED